MPPHPEGLSPRWAWVRPFVLRSLVGALIAAALVGAISALVGEFGPLAGRVLSTIVMFVVISLLIWYDAEVSARRSDSFGVSSLVVSGYLVLVGLVEVWLPRGPDELGAEGGLGSWFLHVLIARIALLHIHLLLNVYRRFPTPGMRGLARVTFSLVGTLAALLSFAVLVNLDVPQAYWRAVAAIAILDGTGTVLIPLVHTLFYRERMPSPVRTSARDTGYGYGNAYGYGQPETRSGPRTSLPRHPAPQQPPLGWPQSPPPPGPGTAGSPFAPPQAQPHAQPQTHAQAQAPGPPDATLLPPAADRLPPEAYVYAPQAPRPTRLEWPRYEDGRPLPVKADGTPDFAGITLRGASEPTSGATV